jgi:hypothetical protein
VHGQSNLLIALGRCTKALYLGPINSLASIGGLTMPEVETALQEQKLSINQPLIVLSIAAYADNLLLLIAQVLSTVSTYK